MLYFIIRFLEEPKIFDPVRDIFKTSSRPDLCDFQIFFLSLGRRIRA